MYHDQDQKDQSLLEIHLTARQKFHNDEERNQMCDPLQNLPERETQSQVIMENEVRKKDKVKRNFDRIKIPRKRDMLEKILVRRDLRNHGHQKEAVHHQHQAKDLLDEINQREHSVNQRWGDRVFDKKDMCVYLFYIVYACHVVRE